MDSQIKFSTHGNKENGSTLEALEWNLIMGELDTVIALIPTGGTGGDGSGSGTGTQSVADTHISKSAKGNIEFVTTQEDLNTEGKGGKINIESYSDILIKPGDDIIFTSSHRPVKNLDEVSVKIHDGQDHPVKLQVNTADIVLTTKDKGSTKVKDDSGVDTNTAMYNDPAVLNITVNSAKDTRGYLKVRAQAIDLRSESHGGIALQPKGNDGQGHENKIKFEHGGGDGLEFGTFNTEKTSIFTNEYRFNKDGVWKMATRTTEASDKAEVDDTTTTRKYVKQSDDFYDIISENDQTATTKDIINAGNVARELKNNGREGYIILVLTEDNDSAAGSIFYNCSNLPPYEGSYKITDLATNVLGASYAQAFIDRIADMDFDDPSDNTVWFTTDAPGSDSNLHAFKVYQQKEISAADNRAAMINSNNLFIKNGTNACKLDDVLSVVTWMKANNQGPWANS